MLQEGKEFGGRITKQGVTENNSGGIAIYLHYLEKDLKTHIHALEYLTLDHQENKSGKI